MPVIVTLIHSAFVLSLGRRLFHVQRDAQREAVRLDDADGYLLGDIIIRGVIRISSGDLLDLFIGQIALGILNCTP